MEKIVFISGQRTPFGAFGGSLKDVSATELTLHAASHTLNTSGILPNDVEQVIVGQVVGAEADSAYLSRHVGLRVGMPQGRGAFTVNRLCGSGFQSWISGAQMMMSKDAQCVLAGGVEQMSLVPYVARGARFGGWRLGPGELEDLMTSALTDRYANLPMAMTAENLGEQYGITRAEADEFAFQSQQRCAKAARNGVFAKEIAPYLVKTKKGEVTLALDEHAKPETTLEKLNSLKSLFKKDGLVTAGTASGIVDGAAMSLLCTGSFAKSKGVQPKVEIVSWAVTGCDPKIMGIGPVTAMQTALQRAGLSFEQMDLIEVNEAFAAQFLAVAKQLKLPPERTNVNGGAIAIGHPLGASGTRIMNHLAIQLIENKLKYAIGSACIGGGQGIAIVIMSIGA